MLLAFSLLAAPASFCQTPFLRVPEVRPFGPGEVIQLTPAQTLQNFYQTKAQAALQDARTMRERYSALSFYAYPRTFWSDKIPLPGLEQEGGLFSASLQTAYEDIKPQPPLATSALAAQTINQIILNPRRGESARQITPPTPGDIWHQAFRMASFYIQLADFEQKLRDERATYEQYQKYLAYKNPAAADYASYDFTLAQNYDPAIFARRRAEIEAFVSAYTAGAAKFIKTVLAPAQMPKIPGADVRAHLAVRIKQSELPPGVTAAKLIDTLTAQIPPAADFYAQAEEINPSAQNQFAALARLSPFALATGITRKGDFGKALSLFEYISPGTLISKVGEHGKIPTHEEANELLASTLAANALNKSLAQMADSLMEFEKPFYYSYHSFSNKERLIAQNWHNIATNAHFNQGKIAAIAADNILQSGRREFQDNLLVQGAQNRQFMANIEFYKKAIPMAVDFVGADGLLAGMVAPVVRSSRLARMARADEVKNILSSLPPPTAAPVNRVRHSASAAAGNMGQGANITRRTPPLNPARTQITPPARQPITPTPRRPQRAPRPEVNAPVVGGDIPTPAAQQPLKVAQASPEEVAQAKQLYDELKALRTPPGERLPWAARMREKLSFFIEPPNLKRPTHVIPGLYPLPDEQYLYNSIQMIERGERAPLLRYNRNRFEFHKTDGQAFILSPDDTRTFLRNHTEHVVETGPFNADMQRILRGPEPGVYFYTPDHYQTFIPVYLENGAARFGLPGHKPLLPLPESPGPAFWDIQTP